jgi:NADH-quinone oxidoreductase subunit G
LISTAPGAEAAALDALELDPTAVILIGERAATAPGTLNAACRLAEKSQAKLAWIPRRAGDRGAIEAGCLPNLLPGGRPVADPKARVDVAAAWGVDLPDQPGLSADEFLADPAKALLVSGVEAVDFADAERVRKAIREAGFVVSLENRASEITALADVVFPVALIEEQSGHFLDWEHRAGAVRKVNPQATSVMTDLRVLSALADALGKPLGVRNPSQAWAELAELAPWEGERPALGKPAPVEAGQGYRLASWRQLIDNSRSIDGAEELLATARAAVLKISPKTAAELKVDCGDQLSVTGPSGTVRLPVAIAAELRDDSVWLPSNSSGSQLSELGVVAGGYVTLSQGGAS